MGGRLTQPSYPAAASARRWPTWRAVCASATGSSHRARAEPGQDAVLLRELPGGGWVAAVADGAGSAPLAAEGAALAVAAAVASVEVGLALPQAFAVARDALGGDDDARSARATTLLVAAVRDGVLEVGQVGDGFVVLRRDGGELEVAVPAPEREYLNETTFLSSAGWDDDLRVDAMDAAPVDAVALSTDGLQLVALDLAAGGGPHPGFFLPLFSWAAADPPDAELAAFLASERVAERTDDDVTLALVVRSPCSPCSD
jgi:hypothetical protein